MNNPYVSYKVVGDKFTYKRFNSDNIVVEEELPLYENGKINSAAVQIVENVRQNKKRFENQKQEELNNQPAVELKTKQSNKNTTLIKLEIRAKLRNIPANISEEEMNKIVQDISNEYNISLEEIANIHAELISKQLNDWNLVKRAEKTEQEKVTNPEKNIKLTAEEYKIVDTFMRNEVPDAEKKSIRRKIEEIEIKYNVSFIQLRTIYKNEKHTRTENTKIQSEISKKQIKDSQIENNKAAAKRMIADFPVDISNEEITMRMEEIERNLNIPKEDLFELYKAGEELRKSEALNTKTTRELFQEKLDMITKEDIKLIGDFLTENPPKQETFDHISKLKEKYGLSDKDIVLAYTVKRKQLENSSKRTVLKSSKLKNERTAKKLEHMIIELKSKNLSTKELAIELNKMAKNYNISQLQMELLYNNAIVSNKAEQLSKKLSKILTGKKIPSRKRNKKEILEEHGLDSADSKKQFIDNGINLVIASKVEDWKEMVEKNYHNPVPIYTAINIMNILENGGGIGQARKELEESHNFSINKGEIIKIVTEYSPYGQEFAKKTKKYIMSNPERLVKFVLDKKASFKKNESKIDEEYDTDLAIKKLEELRNSIIKPEDLDLDNVIEPPSSWKMM